MHRIKVFAVVPDIRQHPMEWLTLGREFKTIYLPRIGDMVDTGSQATQPVYEVKLVIHLLDNGEQLCSTDFVIVVSKKRFSELKEEGGWQEDHSPIFNNELPYFKLPILRIPFRLLYMLKWKLWLLKRGRHLSKQ